MPAKITEHQIDRMVELYQQGSSSEGIAKELGSKAQTITRYLKMRGVEIRGPKKKLSENDKIEFIKLYQNGMSCPKIAEKFNVSDVVVLRYLKAQGIDRRSAEEAHRKYPIREDFFDNIDSEEKAYFLGFLYADGCNHKNANYVSLGLEETDREILVKLASLIYLENPEQHVKTQDRRHEGKGVTAYFTINSKHICEQLEKLGCPQAKTFKITYPEWMPDELHRHFIRGYFDGDGCLFLNEKYGKGSSYAKLTSTLIFCQKAYEIIAKFVPINFAIYDSKTTNVFDLKTSGGKQVKTFMHWIYFDVSIYMNRKFKVYQILIENQNK